MNNTGSLQGNKMESYLHIFERHLVPNQTRLFNQFDLSPSYGHTDYLPVSQACAIQEFIL
jgi:hypothetical protein